MTSIKEKSDFIFFLDIIRHGLLRTHRMAVIFSLIVLLVILSCACEAFADIFRKDAINHPSDSTTVMLYVYLYFFHWIFGWVHNTLFYSNIHLMKSLIYQHLMKMYLNCHPSSFSAVGTGKICSIIHRQADAVTFFLRNVVLELLYNISYLIVFFTGLIKNGNAPLLVWAVFAGLFILASLHTCYMCSVLLDKKRKLINTEHCNSHALLDIFRNLTVVNAFNTESAEIGRYNSLMQKQVKQGEEFYLSETFQNAMFKSLLFVCGISPWLYSLTGNRRISDASTFPGSAPVDSLMIVPAAKIIGYFTDFSSFKGKLSALKNSIYMLFDRFVETSASSAMAIAVEADTSNKSLMLLQDELEIKFDGAAIHIDNVLVFSEFSLVVPFGRKIAITGRNGAGKSTIIKALLGMLDYTGDITVGGKPLAELNRKALHGAISYVPQEPSLFNTTVMANLKYGRSVSDEEVVKRCIECGVHKMFLGLEHGYNTIVGESASNISGGQAQMINFMRAVIRDAPIFLLDEPTSNLDNYTSNLLLSIVFTVLDKKTVFFSTHNPAQLPRFEQILNINEKRIGVYTYEEFVGESNYGDKL